MAWERKFLSLICKNIFFQLQLLLLMGCSLSDIAISDSNLVKFLPGFQGPLPFQLETGYVGVGEAEEVQIFYYFVESQRDPETDPLVLWLTGGPGCSGFSSLVFELGPMKYDKYNMDNESLPTLLINTNSLTKVSNMIFVDSPIGTGFSYATNSLAYQTGDTKQVNFLYHFLHKWLIDHPKFISNPVYIGGDSYSGITVPMLSLHIAKGNEEGLPYINLQGYLLGNPVTNPSRTINFQIPYVHGMGLISDELYKAFEKNCGGEYAIVDPSNVDCLKNFEVYEECTSRIGSEHILEPLCTSASLKSQHIKIRSLTDQVLHGSCIWDYQNTLSGNWVNSPSVRKALHVREVNIGKWQRCHFDLQYYKDVSNSIPYHVILSAKGYRSLIYSGDHDMVVPFLETQAWIRSLNYSIVDDWRPWLVQDQFAGYTRTYSNQMTFTTIKGAGHIAPNWKPKECYSMFQRWLEHQPL